MVNPENCAPVIRRPIPPGVLLFEYRITAMHVSMDDTTLKQRVITRLIGDEYRSLKFTGRYVSVCKRSMSIVSYASPMATVSTVA